MPRKNLHPAPGKGKVIMNNIDRAADLPRGALQTADIDMKPAPAGFLSLHIFWPFVVLLRS